MKAPERLYLSKNIYSTFLYQIPDPDDETAVEYTQTEAFIDKACEWLESVNLDYYQIREGVFSRELVDDFRKAMEE